MNASDLLHVWETGRSLSPLDRVRYLLAGAGWTDSESMTVGHKNRALLGLREQLFGPQMDCVARCPACAERLEFTLTTSALASPQPHNPGPAFSLEHEGITLTVRQPLLRDLQRAQGSGTALYECCLLEARRGETAVDLDILPETVRQRVAEALLQDDPLLDIKLALTCPACGAAWSSPLDLLAFLWQEIDRWGRRTLRTIHYLASAYGWSEADILAMSAWRRGRYLELLNDG